MARNGFYDPGPCSAVGQVVAHALYENEFRSPQRLGGVLPSFDRHQRVIGSVYDESGYVQGGKGGFSVAVGQNGHELANHALGVKTAVITIGDDFPGPLAIERKSGAGNILKQLKHMFYMGRLFSGRRSDEEPHNLWLCLRELGVSGCRVDGREAKHPFRMADREGLGDHSSHGHAANVGPRYS